MKKKVWVESDENMLEGVDFNKVIPKLDKILKEKKKTDSLNQMSSKKSEERLTGTLEQRILKANPELTPERLEEMLKSH